MKCLCCGKPIKDDALEEEKRFSWHQRCIKGFFESQHFPQLDLSSEGIGKMVSESVSKNMTVTGVQKKFSLHIDPKGKSRLTLINCPSGFIIKPQTEEYPFLPEWEHLAMSMARFQGIKTVPFALIKAGEHYAYITKRIDRFEGQKLAMEDFCQLDNRLTEDKYKGSYERCAKIIKRYSSKRNFDLSELFIRVVFSFVIGNSDMHLKNFSLIEEEIAKGNYSLSPAYDLLPVKMVLPEDEEELALTLNGKKTHLRRKDFLIFAENIGLSKSAATKMMGDIVSSQSDYLSIIEESFLGAKEKESFSDFINQRISLIAS